MAGRGDEVWRESVASKEDRRQAVEDFATVCEYVHITRLWRPNLRDEGDNHIMELAICGNASVIITFNVSDFIGALFAPPGLLVLMPAQFLKEYPL